VVRRGSGALIPLSHFVAKIFNVLKVPSMVVTCGRDKTRQRAADGVRRRKYEQKAGARPDDPARELRIPFDEVFPDLKKLPWRFRMWAQAILLGHETVPIAEGRRPLSATELAEGRKVIDEILAGGGRRSPRQQTKQQRLIARVQALRAEGKKKAVEIACDELGVPRSTAFEWLRADSPRKSKKLD
jgi:hypothetical protein